MRLRSCQLAREEVVARMWIYVHTNTRTLFTLARARTHTHTYIRTQSLYLPSKSTGHFWLYLGVWKTHRGVCAAAGPIMISMQMYVWLLLFLSFVEWGELYFSISCCQQVALLWILLWKTLILLLHLLQRVTIWQPIYNCECVCAGVEAGLRSVKLCSLWPLPCRLPVEGPGGAACIAWPSSQTFFHVVSVSRKRSESVELSRGCRRDRTHFYMYHDPTR